MALVLEKLSQGAEVLLFEGLLSEDVGVLVF
jgi:hypothetical protein